MFETPQYRVMDNFTLQIMDYAFVFAMGGEIWMKILVSCLNSYIIKDDKSTSIELNLRPPSDKSISFSESMYLADEGKLLKHVQSTFKKVS